MLVNLIQMNSLMQFYKLLQAKSFKKNKKDESNKLVFYNW